MSEVWLAHDSQTDSQVALKRLSGDADARHKELLQREWRIGSRLMHANIIRVFEFHDDPDGALFSQQYVGDTELGVLAGKEPSEALRPVGLLADALRYAHGKGVVHRDVKAANVLLDSRGAPYLVDFGVAATHGSDAVSGSGSAIAMSPEQSAGDAATTADDIFALGVLIHELLTGAPPGGADRRELSAKLPDGTPMPGALVTLLSDMLHADASARPTAETVAERLSAAGFPAGPAPARYVKSSAAEEVLEQVAPASTFRRAAAPDAQPLPSTDKSTGISPKMLYSGLGVALVLFLAVIFVLPNLVGGDRAPVAESPVSAETPTIDTDDPSPSSETADDSGAVPVSGNTEATDEALGDLVSQLERLRYRAIERWGGQEYLDVIDVYAEGDQAYVDKNYRLAGEKYREATRMLAPFFDRIDSVFEETLAEAEAAFERADAPEAVRLYDLAVAITPGHRAAEAGLERASNLDAVLSLVEQGNRYEANLEYDAARLAFEKALELDAQWEPATVALARILVAIKNLSFEQRMTEGFDALMAGDFDSARAAFNAAKLLNPDSREPSDGLLQVEQEMKLADIRRMEAEAIAHDQAEEWETSIGVYQNILKIDADLQFAQQGLAFARNRAAVHARLQEYIDDPDNLSDDANMQNATRLLLDVARTDPMGPRLEDQKNELSRLLKRASTPLAVRLVSDGVTEISLFRIGRFGSFMTHDLELRPGNYVAVGIRPGYRDVRVEFRVAPEIEMEPVVVMCREPI
jgi:serine/threonine protein kinase